MTGIDRGVLARWPVQLSGGQRQRLGVMRALFLDPDVVLMDEPLGALDNITRRKLQGELRALFQPLGKTLVVVTHDVHEAALLSDEAIVMRDGLVVQRGTIDAMAKAPADGFVRELLDPGGPVIGARSPWPRSSRQRSSHRAPVRASASSWARRRSRSRGCSARR